MSNTLKRLITKANYRPTLNVVSTDILSRSFAGETSAFSLPDLPYEYNDLEPVLPAKIMELHHSKHHQTYVNNLNASLQKRDDAIGKLDIAAVVALDGAIKFNGIYYLIYLFFIYYIDIYYGYIIHTERWWTCESFNILE